MTPEGIAENALWDLRDRIDDAVQLGFSLDISIKDARDLAEQIRAYGRQERAAGLRAAASKARSYKHIWSGHTVILKQLSSWCDRRATKIAKGKR